MLRGHESLRRTTYTCDIGYHKDYEASKLKKGRMESIHKDSFNSHPSSPQCSSNKAMSGLYGEYFRKSYESGLSLMSQTLQSPVVFWAMIGG